MTEEEILLPVKRFINEALNQGKGEVIREVWADDMVWEGGSMGTVNGIDPLPAMVSKRSVTCI